MVKKIVIANLISYGIATIVSLAALPITVKISEKLIALSMKNNE